MSTYRGASAAAIEHHYDVGNDFYALWLDAARVYSCAMWSGGDGTLEHAQARKLDYIAGLAGAPGAARVLDVGCGWGGMLRRLGERHGVSQAVGLTLSPAQAEWVAGWARDGIEVHVENWADHEPEAPYDAIVSIGAFEHFADFGLSRAERVDAYREFFARCWQWLAPGGRIGLQTCAKGNNVRLDRDATRELLFIADRIFPESELPWLSELVEASERRFDVVSVRNDPDDYARTCGAWLERLRANRRSAEALVDAEVVAAYERYLAASVRAFRRRHLGLLRVALQRL
jgi:cyclopropane-fatty-acyl-phospholipid synthase